jgi:hypothetical protein
LIFFHSRFNFHLQHGTEIVTSNRTAFSGSSGHFDCHKIDSAIEEFEDCIKKGQDLRLLVARDINVYKWMKSSLSKERRWVYFEVEYNGDRVNKRSVGDLYIIKNRDYLQQLALDRLNLLIIHYMEQNGDFFTTCPGCESIDGHNRIRDVDTFLWFNEEVIAIFEVDCKSRSLPFAHAYCLEHFVVTPSLRAVLLIKVFLRGQDYRRIALVAVLYLRGASGPAVADAVSFGTRSLDAADVIPREVARKLRSLPTTRSGPPGHQRRPWTPAQRPYITVPAVELFGKEARRVPAWRPTLKPGPGPRCRRGSAEAPTDFALDLWPILKQVDTFASGERFQD